MGDLDRLRLIVQASLALAVLAGGTYLAAVNVIGSEAVVGLYGAALGAVGAGAVGGVRPQNGHAAPAPGTITTTVTERPLSTVTERTPEK